MGVNGHQMWKRMVQILNKMRVVVDKEADGRLNWGLHYILWNNGMMGIDFHVKFIRLMYTIYWKILISFYFSKE